MSRCSLIKTSLNMFLKHQNSYSVIKKKATLTASEIY